MNRKTTLCDFHKLSFKYPLNLATCLELPARGALLENAQRSESRIQESHCGFNQRHVASGNTDRYRSAPTISDASRDRRFDDESLTATNFDLLLNLPLFESKLPETSTGESSATSVQPDSKKSEVEASEEEKEERDDEATFLPVPIAKTWDEYRRPFVDEEAQDSLAAKIELKSITNKTSDSKPTSSDTSEKAVQHAVFNPVKNSGDDRQEIQPVNGVKAVDTQDQPVITANETASKLTNDESLDDHNEQNLAETPTEFAPKTSDRREEPSKDKHDDAIHSNEVKIEPVKSTTSQRSLENQHQSRPDSDAQQDTPKNKADNDNQQSRLNRRAERLADNRREPSDQPTKELGNEVKQTVEPKDPIVSAGNDTSKVDAIDPNTLGATTTTTATTPTVTAPVAIPASTNAVANRLEPGASSVPAAKNTPSIGALTNSSTTTGSTGYSPKSSSTPTAGSSTLTEYQEQRVLQRVARGMEQLQNGGGQVRLRLHPPELGSLQVTIRVEAQQMAALIEVEHTAARDVLENNLPQLQARLADQGMTVQQFEIRVVDPNQFSQGDQLGNAWQQNSRQSGEQREERRASNYIDRLRNRIDTPTNEPPTPNPRLWTRTNGRLDVRV